VRKGKRKQREHVSCEKAREKYARSGSMAVAETSEPEQIQNTEPEPVLFRDCSASMEHDGHESLSESEYRYFIRASEMERILSITPKLVPIRVEILPVPAEQVDSNWEHFAEYVQLNFNES
jgi:hypothetical protein